MTGISVEQIDLLDKLLRVLQAQGVRTCKIGKMVFELGNLPRPSLVMGPVSFDGETDEQREARRKRELEEIMFGSSGG